MKQYEIALDYLRKIQRRAVTSAQWLEKLVESEPPPGTAKNEPQH